MDKYPNRQNLMWGFLLIVFGVASLIDSVITLHVWWWVTILFFAGGITIAVFWTERSNWAYLVPAFVLWSISGLLILFTLKIIHNEAVATYVLIVITLPFIIGFLRDRTRWGLIIPVYVLFSVGLMVGLIGLHWLNDFLIPTYVMFAIALPFLLVYLLNPIRRWSLIPGGITGIIGLAFLLATPSARISVPSVWLLLDCGLSSNNYFRVGNSQCIETLWL